MYWVYHYLYGLRRVCLCTGRESHTLGGQILGSIKVTYTYTPKIVGLLGEEYGKVGFCSEQIYLFQKFRVVL